MDNTYSIRRQTVGLAVLVIVLLTIAVVVQYRREHPAQPISSNNCTITTYSPTLYHVRAVDAEHMQKCLDRFHTNNNNLEHYEQLRDGSMFIEFKEAVTVAEK